MRIAFVGTSAISVYLFRADLIVDLVSKGHVVYALVNDLDKASEEKIRNLGATPIKYVLSRSSINPVKGIQAILDLKNILIEVSPDVVISYFIKPVIFGTLAAKLAGVKSIIGMIEGLGHAFTEYPGGRSIKQKMLGCIVIRLLKFSSIFLDKIIFLNNDDKNELLNKYKLKVKDSFVLGGIGVNLDFYQYKRLNSGIINFLFVGRLLREKGVFEFLEAAKVVKLKYPLVQFTIVGGLDLGNLSSLKGEELDRLIKEKYITYAGEVEDVRPWITSCSALVLPSYREGLPRSVQEAMAIGRAIITTNVPGCRETVSNGINGILIDPFSIDQLIDSMEFMISNPARLIDMGDNSFKIAFEKFDSRKINDSFLKFLNIN